MRFEPSSEGVSRFPVLLWTKGSRRDAQDHEGPGDWRLSRIQGVSLARVNQTGGAPVLTILNITDTNTMELIATDDSVVHQRWSGRKHRNYLATPAVSHDHHLCQPKLNPTLSLFLSSCWYSR